VAVVRRRRCLGAWARAGDEGMALRAPRRWRRRGRARSAALALAHTL